MQNYKPPLVGSAQLQQDCLSTEGGAPVNVCI